MIRVSPSFGGGYNSNLDRNALTALPTLLTQPGEWHQRQLYTNNSYCTCSVEQRCNPEDRSCPFARPDRQNVTPPTLRFERPPTGVCLLSNVHMPVRAVFISKRGNNLWRLRVDPVIAVVVSMVAFFRGGFDIQAKMWEACHVCTRRYGHNRRFRTSSI